MKNGKIQELLIDPICWHVPEFGLFVYQHSSFKRACLDEVLNVSWMAPVSVCRGGLRSIVWWSRVQLLLVGLSGLGRSSRSLPVAVGFDMFFDALIEHGVFWRIYISIAWLLKSLCCSSRFRDTLFVWVKIRNNFFMCASLRELASDRMYSFRQSTSKDTYRPCFLGQLTRVKICLPKPVLTIWFIIVRFASFKKKQQQMCVFLFFFLGWFQ